jgi:hypothetical protein
MQKNEAALRKFEAPLFTPTDLSPNAIKEIASAMNAILADVFALYLKSKNFHWHISDPYFRDYHPVVFAQLGEHLRRFDVRRIVVRDALQLRDLTDRVQRHPARSCARARRFISRA